MRMHSHLLHSREIQTILCLKPTLRRAVWLNIVRGMSYKDIATTLFMCEKSVLALFHGTGSVTPQPPTGGPGKVLNELEEFTVMQSIIHKPTLFLQEVQEHLYNATGKWVSASTVCRTIKAKEFTRKKVQVIYSIATLPSVVILT